MRNISVVFIICFLATCSIFNLRSNSALAVLPPVVVTTCEATDVTSSSATLGGVVSYYAEPSGLVTVWFKYGTVRDYYNGTSSTRNVSGTTTTTTVSINISNLIPDTKYYYRIAMQSENFGEGGGREKSFTTLPATPTVTGMATPTPTSTLDCNCIIPGRVTDAITGKGIKNAIISERTVSLGTAFTDADGYYSWYDPEELVCCGGAYTLTASADGYTPVSQLIDIDPCIPRTLDFDLQPITIPTPVFTVTPIFECNIKRIKVLPGQLRLKRGQSGEVVVSLGGDNCVPEGYTVTAVVNKAGSRRISISSTNEVSDRDGEAKFTIAAKERIGNAKVTFKVNQLEKTILVKVRK